MPGAQCRLRENSLRLLVEEGFSAEILSRRVEAGSRLFHGKDSVCRSARFVFAQHIESAGNGTQSETNLHTACRKWLRQNPDSIQAAGRFIPPAFVMVGDYLDYLEQQRLYSPQVLYRNATKFFTALGSMLETDKPRTRFDASP